VTESKPALTRRDFMRGLACGALGLALGDELRAAEPPASRKRARVVLVRDEKAIGPGGGLNAKVVAQMLDDSLCALLDEKRAPDCWRRLVKPSDLVGIKTNAWQPLGTPPEVEQAIKRRLLEAGVPEDRIRIDDRGARQTLAACTALINVRPLRAHYWAGIGGCIKNYIIFAPQPSAYHPDSCADLAALWSLPAVRGKTRLNLLLALTPQFYGRGPHGWDPRYVWPYQGVFLSQDPVAVDALGAQLLQVKRRLYFGEDKPITPTKHILLAEFRHHLGVSDLKRIDLLRLGWKKEMLI
jgi:hypothetical protein